MLSKLDYFVLMHLSTIKTSRIFLINLNNFHFTEQVLVHNFGTYVSILLWPVAC